MTDGDYQLLWVVYSLAKGLSFDEASPKDSPTSKRLIIVMLSGAQ